MADEYDIYGDLEGFEEEAAQDNKVVQELNAQIAELREQIAEKEQEKQDTIARNTVLLENISSLLVTAKAELKRKDAVIADIRREKDNAAFRRKRHVQRHDKGTQTALVRLLSREVQTEVEEAPQRFKREREKQTEWHWERKRAEEEHERRERERFKAKERVPVRQRLGVRGLAHQEGKMGRGRRGRDRSHNEERERERQARRGPRTPDADRHPVKFRSPVRVKTDESSIPDSASDIELSRAFIPMNRKELDRYVKEIGREQNRSPVVVEITKQDKTSKSLEEVSCDELWDTRPRKKSKTPKKHRKHASNTPIKPKSPAIIQSDEIGTTACGSSILSPVKSEDIEQRMSALHGHPPLPEPQELIIPPPEPPIIEHVPELPQEDDERMSALHGHPPSEPPELIIPPPEPPIIEHVPELPQEDDVKLNDSRELRIIESSDELVTTQGGVEPAVEDERNSSTETVIERSRVEDEEDLEDGEIITPAPSPAPPSKADIAESKRNAKIAKLEQQETKSQHKEKRRTAKLKRKRADKSPKIEPNPTEVPPPAKEPTPEQDKSKHKRNLNGAFELPAAAETTTKRRNTFSVGSVGDDKTKRKARLSEPSAVAAARTVVMQKTEHALFGSDDDTEATADVAHGKRKRTESAREMVESKKSRKSGENGCIVILLDVDVPKDKDETVVDNKIVPEIECSKAEQEDEKGEVTEEKSVPDDDNQVLQSDSATSVESKDVPESESTTGLNGTVQSDENEISAESEPAINGKEAPENEVQPGLKRDEDVTKSEAIDDTHVEEVAQESITDLEAYLTPAQEGSQQEPPKTIVMSTKYCEYRIEEDNEVETTFYVTRKKKRKTKSKSQNASLNAIGAN